jgi:hypothetical protein
VRSELVNIKIADTAMRSLATNNCGRFWRTKLPAWQSPALRQALQLRSYGGHSVFAIHPVGGMTGHDLDKPERILMRALQVAADAACTSDGLETALAETSLCPVG